MREDRSWGEEIDGGFFSESDHRYRCTQGVVRPSATQVFSLLGMSNFSAIKPEVMQWKREYGNAVHVAGQFLAGGDLDWDSLDDVIIPAVTGIEGWLKRYEFEPISAEETKIRTLCGMKYGTRLDLRGTLMYHGKRRHAIVDYKTGSRSSPTWTWQLGSYSAEQEEVPGGWMGVALQVGMDGDVEPHWVTDIAKAKREFQALLAPVILGLNAGIYKLA